MFNTSSCGSRDFVAGLKTSFLADKKDEELTRSGIKSGMTQVGLLNCRFDNHL